MLIDGEKWACDACVRGHRVSSCTHSGIFVTPNRFIQPSNIILDRPLQHINKKGRPVSQCPHCRGLRKARSSHVRCECAEKDPLLKRESAGENRHAIEKTNLIQSFLDTCACPSGQRCTCNLKKEHLEPIAEIKQTKPRSRANTDTRKPRLVGNNSDPPMTVFTNGHHKPVHRNNHAGHDFAPYKIPRPHSIHGPGSFAQRSMDNISSMSTYANPNSIYSTALSNLQHESQRLVRSAHGSPGLYPTRFDQFSPLTNLDLNFPAYNTSITSSPSGDEYTRPFQSAFESIPIEEAPRSAPLTNPGYDWSAMDLPLDVGALPATYNQPPSYASFDQSHISGQEMANPSSADLSEVEDYLTQGLVSPTLGEESPFVPSPQEKYSSTESFHSNNQTATFNPSLDAMTMNSFVPPSPTSPFDPHELSNGISPDPEAFTRHGITVQDAQKLAHPCYSATPSVKVHNPVSGQSGIAMTTSPTSDPSWAAAYNVGDEDTGFVHQSMGLHDANWMA